jgi:HPt (histidine-containing phosphotransfer) domain-containing protein
VEPIRSVYEGDPDMLEIVREFARELPERARALEERLAVANLGELARLAHQLKGAGGGYGFPRITELAAQLETALKQGAELAVVKDRLADLTRALRSVVVPERP